MFRISGISRAEYLGIFNIVMLLCAPWFMGTALAKDAESLLREGRVCLTLAPQAEHDMRAYTYACNYMKDALAAAPAGEKAAYQASVKQCDGMIDMAKDAYRNVMPMLAWLTDVTAEFREPYEPPIELAIEQAFTATVPMMKFTRVNQLPVFPRCAAGEDECEGVHENILTFARGNPGLLPVQNADLVAWGFDPSSLRDTLGTPSESITKQLHEKTQWNHAVLVDVHPRGEAACPMNTASAEVRAWLWNLETGKIRLLGQQVSATIDGRTLKSYGLYLLLVVALLLGVLGWIKPFILTEAKKVQLVDRAASCIVGIVAGFGMGYGIKEFGLPLVEPFTLEMDAYSFSASGRLRLGLFLYPIALGVLLYIAPVAICLALGAVARARVAKLGIHAVRWAALVPLMQLGATGLVASAIPINIGTPGYLWAAILGLPPALLGLSTVRPLSFISDADAGKGRTAMPLLIAAVGWLIYLPVMCVVANADTISPVALSLAGALALAAGIIFFISGDLSEGSATEEAEAEGESISTEGHGSLKRPAYLGAGTRDTSDTSPLMTQCATGATAQVWLTGASGAGKTRTATELISAMKNAAQGSDLIVARGTGEASLEDPASADSIRTFGFATDVLKRLCPMEERLAILEEREARMAATEGAVGALEGLPLPGVDLLMGLAEEAPPGGMTLNWLAEDMTQAIIDRAGQHRVVLFLDDIDQADEDSVLLFARIRERLAAREQELGHPVTWILTTKEPPSAEVPADGPATIPDALAALGTFGPIIGLGSLDEETALALIQCAGLGVRQTDTVSWLLENTQGGLPGELLGLLRHLDTIDVIEDEKGQRFIPLTATLQEHPDSIPKDLIECQRRALEILPIEERFLLEMAAQCGRRFTASSLSAGLESRPLDILKMLRRIEAEQEFVHDEDQEDVFQFSSESVRRALRMMTARRLSSSGTHSEDAEVVRTFHYQTAKALLDDAPDSPTVDPERLLWHCQRAGKRMELHALRVSLDAADHTRSLFAWKRVLQFVETAKELAHRQTATPAQSARMAFLEGMARKGLGGQENRDIAYTLLKGLLVDGNTGSTEVPEFETLQACLEVRYEEKTIAELTSLVEWIESWADTAELRDPLSSLVSALYLELARGGLDRSRNPLPVLRTLHTTLEGLDSSRDRDLLLARVAQSIADRLSWGERKSFDEIKPYWDQSFALKVQHGDLAGQALTLGTQGTYVLFCTDDLDRAIDLLEQDLTIVKKMGDEGPVSGLINKLATARFKRAERLEGEARTAAQRDALQDAEMALDIAVRLEREGDILFAAHCVMDFACQLEDPAAFDRALEPAMDRSVWEEFGALGMMLGKYGSLDEPAGRIGRQAQVTGITALITALQAERESATT